MLIRVQFIMEEVQIWKDSLADKYGVPNITCNVKEITSLYNMHHYVFIVVI